MSKILCAYSGVEFKVEHFNMYLTSRECFHPIFTLPQKRLLSYTSRWAEGSLTETENYLLYLALLNSTELIEWRVPAVRTVNTSSVIAQSMEHLLQIIGKINLTDHPSLKLPRFVISPETKDLSNAPSWIQIWEEAWKDFQDAYKSSNLIAKISRREAALERLIKDKTKDIESYAGILAEWADNAGNFPKSLTLVSNKYIPLNEYWKHIIKKCSKSDALFEIPEEDLDELIEYVEENLELVSHGIFSHTLITLLRSSKEKRANFLDLGNISSYRILDANTSIEDANKLTLIDSAPVDEPQAKDYPSKIAYLRAKLKYDMAKHHKEESDKLGGVNI